MPDHKRLRHEKNGDVMPHKVGWLVRGPCANSAGASQPPQPAAGVGFFVSALSRAFCEFSAVRLHRVGLGRVGLERQARRKLQQARPGGRSGRGSGGLD